MASLGTPGYGVGRHGGSQAAPQDNSLTAMLSPGLQSSIVMIDVRGPWKWWIRQLTSRHCGPHDVSH